MEERSFWENVPVIYSYTRANAIEDGVLIDITPLGREAGFKYPVAITAAAMERYIVPREADRKRGQSEDGRLWDVLSVMRSAALSSRGTDTLTFDVLFMVGGKILYGGLKSVMGPGDTPEPVLTIMLPEED